MELLGTLGAAQYTTNFFQIFIDFGFILSATAEVSRQREDRDALAHILTSVISAKALFSLLSFGVLFLFVRPGLADAKEFATYLLFLLGTVLNSLLPDFMYRGLEQMTTITVRAVSIRVFATVMIFLFIHQPGDYYMVPLFTAIGNAGALAFVYWHLFCKVGGAVLPGHLLGGVPGDQKFLPVLYLKGGNGGLHQHQRHHFEIHPGGHCRRAVYQRGQNHQRGEKRHGAYRR